MCKRVDVVLCLGVRGGGDVEGRACTKVIVICCEKFDLNVDTLSRSSNSNRARQTKINVSASISVIECMLVMWI